MHANAPSRPAGVISLLALILMAAVTATAVGASLIIINELRQTQAVDQATVASYAAESGVELGLAIVQNERQNPDGTLADTETKLNRFWTAVSDALPAASWQRSVSPLTSLVVPLLAPDQSVSVDYVDPDTSGASNVESFTLQWEDDCRGNTQIEASALTWGTDAFGQLDFSPDAQRVFKQVVGCGTSCTGLSEHCACEPTAPINAFIQPYATNQLEDLNAGNPYRFTFRPILVRGSLYSQCVITNLKVTAYNAESGAGDVVAIPTMLQFKAVARFGNALQAVTAQLPWRAPASGLLSFVLFSEESIEK